MAGETILIIDAGEDINQRMTATLEAEGYLIYTVTNQDVNAEMAELLKPSLLYIKPADLTPAGLEPCKAIHGIPLLINVPVVILESLKRPLGSEYLEEYGIVDFLEPTFGPEELVEKTGTILGKALPSRHPKENKPAALQGVTRKEGKKRFALLRPAIGIVALLVIAGAGFMAYQQFMPAQKVLPPPPPKPRVRVPPIASKVELKPQLPPASNVADISPPTSSIPSKPPEQPALVSSESTSQPPHKPFFSVQLGAFKDEEKAQALTKKFREKGYDAFTQPGVTKDKSPIYRVLVSRYEDRKAAKKLAGEIQSREQIETTLYDER